MSADTATMERIARCLEDFAEFEESRFARQLFIAMAVFPHQVVRCEGCQSATVVIGGLCPTCLRAAASACRGER